MIFILIIVENCMYFDDMKDFSVRLRTGSNPPDNNQFRSHTGNNIADNADLISYYVW